MADVVVWNQDPFSVYAKPLQVYIDGTLRYEHGNSALNPSILSWASSWGNTMKSHKFLTACLVIHSRSERSRGLTADHRRNGVRGDDSPSSRQDILIVDGRIEAVGERLAIDDADSIIDAAGRPVTSAFFAGITATGLVKSVRCMRRSIVAERFIHGPDPSRVRCASHRPHSSVVPVTRVEGYSYTLLVASPGDRTISGRGSLVRLDGGYDSFEGACSLMLTATATSWAAAAHTGCS